MTFVSVATPCFPVADISATMSWYQTHLGFDSDPFPPSEPYVFCILRRDNVEIMLQRVEGYQKPHLYDHRNGGVWDVYLRTEGTKALYESLRDRVEILKPLRQQPYGAWEFEVRDLNGYVLVFGE
jgi:uncharacterized glyoxalase superfamily protein PhnB